MREYHFKHGSYPLADTKNFQEFYDGWFEGCGVYENVLEMTEKITYLQSRYVDNVVKKMNGEDVEGQMDPIDKQIFMISHDIWGLKDDGHGVVNNDNVDENFGVNDLEDFKESFNQESDGDQRLVKVFNLSPTTTLLSSQRQPSRRHRHHRRSIKLDIGKLKLACLSKIGKDPNSILKFSI
ncbi:hypothetical protein Tco_0573986 [Tanacetum coccineum]